jgi:2'-5' RNA ligase
MRLFVGMPVSLETVDGLSGAAESLARRAQGAKVRVRWLAPATYHVTLKFLGACREEAVGAIAGALERAAAGVEPFRFTTSRLGAFPSTQKASVVWAGVEDGGRLAALAARIEAEVEPLGFARESRRFHPHVTIGRLRDLADVAEVLLPMQEQSFSETRAGEIVLYESSTKPSGSEYTPVRTIRLGVIPGG